MSERIKIVSPDSLSDPLARLVFSDAVAGQSESQAKACMGFFFGAFGFPQQYEDAAFWAKRAAHQGEPKGQYIFALCLQDGLGAPRDVMAADAWFLMAANAGDAEAQAMVGTSLLLTATERYKWLLLASESSFENTAQFAKDEIAQLKPSLSASQVEDAETSLWTLKRVQEMREK